MVQITLPMAELWEELLNSPLQLLGQERREVR
jgi:hypothetical protein